MTLRDSTASRTILTPGAFSPGGGVSRDSDRHLASISYNQPFVTYSASGEVLERIGETFVRLTLNMDSLIPVDTQKALPQS